MITQFLLKKSRFSVFQRGLNLFKPTVMRTFTSFNVDYYKNRFLTSNMFCLVRNPLCAQPFISVTQKIKIPIEEGKTIKDMEKETQTKNQVNSLDFFTHDGARISKSTHAETLSTLPYFKLIIDNKKEYIVISEKSFSFHNQKYELEGNVKKFYDYCKDMQMDDDKALLLSKYSSDVVEKLSQRKEWSKDDFIDEAFEGLVQIAHDIREEKDILQAQYDLLKEHRKPLDVVKGHIDREAEIYAKRKISLMFYIIAAQFALVQYGTYILFSWDIMEPITCGMTLGDAVFAYFFWARTKCSYTLSGVFNHYFLKKKNKLAKKENFDQENYDKIETALRIFKKRIRQLK